jgi:hypothetical protein
MEFHYNKIKEVEVRKNLLPTKERRRKLLWRIPLVVAILFAIFWGIWYLVAGEVPVVTQISFGTLGAIQLPFAVSCFWDIVFAPIWAIVLILLFTDKRIMDDPNFGPAISVTFFLLVGLIFGLNSGLGVGLVAGLAAGLSVGLGVGLVAILVAGLKFLFSKKPWAWLAGK